MGWLAPAFLSGLIAISIPVLIHLIHRERRQTIAFPSLMFLRKIPYRSVRRQKLRHLSLLALRCLAIAIVASAFARPFLERRLPVTPALSDAREIVVVLDRSYSMAYGGRWARATAAVRALARELRPSDRLTLVAFAASAAQITEPTSSAARVETAVASLHPGSEPTRIAAGLRMAAQILAASERPRREVVLISDYHRFGWTPSDEAPLPPRVVVKPVDVSRGESTDLAVAHVAVARDRAGDRTRATVTARVTNLGTEPQTAGVTLELAGRPVDTRRVTVPARATAQAVFGAVSVSDAPMRGVVRIGRDSQPSNDALYFVTAKEAGASALILEPSQPRANQSLYLARAWSVADDPPVQVDVRDVALATAADVRGRSLIVLNETDLPAALAAAARREVEAGAVLFAAAGDRLIAWPTGWQTRLPAALGPAVDRPDGARWTAADFSNRLFEPFRAAGRADFSSVAVMRYRTLTPADSGSVIARLDDGAPLLVERALGAGRVMLWATSFDARWTDLPFHPLWVPLLHQLARRALAGRESPAWFTAPHVLDLSRERGVLVESPSGQRTRVDSAAAGGSIELLERGFYEVRGGATAIGAGRPVAVNVDLAESDLSHFDPAELIASLTTRTERGANAGSSTALTGTPQETERRQSIWWYLLVAAALLLAVETIFAGRISRPTVKRSAPLGREVGGTS